MYPSSIGVPFILCGQGLAKTLSFKTLSETWWVMCLATYSNSPWASSHEISVIVSSWNRAILGLEGVGQEVSSSKSLFVTLLESSSFGSNKVLPEDESCCYWHPSPLTCGVTGLNSVIVLKKYPVFHQFLTKIDLLQISKKKPNRLTLFLLSNVQT